MNSHVDRNGAEIKQLLTELHESYLKDNKYDEGDLLYYRINYKVMDAFQITKEEAEKLHTIYHDKNNPRRISEGYCHNCKSINKVIPIIYGVGGKDKANLTKGESEGRLIVGNLEEIKEGAELSMFACKICKIALPKYGTIL
jgi:hypothetical protein